MNETLQKALDAITAAQPADEGPMWMVGEQLKDILLGEPALAGTVLEDFSAKQKPLAECEAKIHEYAKKHGGCCTPKAAEKIIREHFGLPETPSAGCADSSLGEGAGMVAVDLDSFF